MHKRAKSTQRARQIVAAAMAAMLCSPLPALAAEPTSEVGPLEANYSSTNINDSYVRAHFSKSTYTYTGSAITPKPTVFIDLDYAYSYDFIDWADFYGYYDDYYRDIYNNYYNSYDYYYLYGDDWYSYDWYDNYLSDSWYDYYWNDYSAFERFIDLYYLQLANVIIDPYDNSGYVYVLDEYTDYTLSYRNNVNPGTATCTITGKGDFTGSRDLMFTITNNGSSSSGTSTTYTGYQRLGGTTRYATMSEIVNYGFTGNTNTAIVATGSNFPDALAASSLAGVYNAPVILTDSNILSNEASSKLYSLNVRTVYLMGGESAISSNVENAIRNMGITVERVYGYDRVETSLKAMEYTLRGGTTSDTVIIATGYNYADSLSIGPWAYATKSPIVLTNSDGTLSQQAVNTIKNDSGTKSILIVGGTSAVSDYVKNQLGTYNNAGYQYTYKRIGGNNRYDTSKLIAEFAINTSFNFSWRQPIIATGRNFPDALAGAAYAGRNRSVMLLVSSSTDPTVTVLGQHRGNVNKLIVLGGENAVSSSLVSSIENTLRNGTNYNNSYLSTNTNTNSYLSTNTNSGNRNSTSTF